MDKSFSFVSSRYFGLEFTHVHEGCLVSFDFGQCVYGKHLCRSVDSCMAINVQRANHYVLSYDLLYSHD